MMQTVCQLWRKGCTGDRQHQSPGVSGRSYTAGTGTIYTCLKKNAAPDRAEVQIARLVILAGLMVRVRFAPSPTGFLHIGSARTFIFNWLFARPNAGTMILRIDDTDVSRNTDASLQSIYDGLNWLDLGWDEHYRASERIASHREAAEEIFRKGLAYRDFTPAHTG